MDLAWGSPASRTFVTNVGLITTNGPQGHNIMACEWTHHVSYSPGLIAVCVGPGKVTHANIRQSKEFGVSISSADQSVLSSVSGGYSGKEIDKIAVLKALGFEFYPAKRIQVMMVKGAVLHAECRLVQEVELGDHTMFVGEVVDLSVPGGKDLLVLHGGQYWKLTNPLPNPSDEERQKISRTVAGFRRQTRK